MNFSYQSEICNLKSLLPFPLPFDELLHHGFGVVIWELDDRMFHRIGRDGEERATDPPVTPDLAASDRIDRHPTAIG